MKQNILNVLVLSLLSGCAVGPDYVSPNLGLDGSYSEKGEGSEEYLDKSWWHSFEDKVLSELINEAVESNKEIKQSLSRINQARALARQAFAELLPGTQLRADYERSRSTGARFPGEGEDEGRKDDGFRYEIFTGGIDAAWEIDIFGRLRRELEARNAAYSGSVASLNDVLRIITSEVALSYFQLRAAQGKLEISKKNLSIQEETFKFIETKVKYGTASELDSARAEAQLESTRAIVPMLELEIKAQIHRLSVLLGKQPRELVKRLEEPQPLPEFNGPTTIGTPEMLLRHRPDLIVAERNLASQNALIGVAVGELFPKITISGSIGVESETFSGLSGGAGTYSWGPSIKWTPFDVGRLRSRVKAQDAKTEEALLAYEQAVLLALEDVENSLASVSAQNRRLASVEKAYQAASRAHKLAIEQYEEGVIDFLSVLDAQETALSSEQEMIETKKNSVVAIVQLYKALGGGWQEWKVVSN